MDKWIKVRVLKNGKEAFDEVALERDLRLVINSKVIASVKLSPGHEREFALGYCLGEGFVKSRETIRSIEVDDTEIRVLADDSILEAFERYISSECLTGWRTRIKEEGIGVASEARFSASEIFENMRRMQEQSTLWRRTGGVHSAALVSGDAFLLVEDVSRHVAIDKIIGLGAERGVDLEHSYILTSGRMPGDMVIKAARVGIPLIASRTAPIFSGILAAERTGLTLIGFVRGKRMNIYTHAWRVLRS
ncbi:formate dehydrogenase accessory sulfurtransferase FdhD [Candidatus Pyrohabitans sp.]